MVGQVVAVPACVWPPAGYRVSGYARYQVGHLDKGVETTVLMDRASDKPAPPPRYVRLASGKRPIEAVSNEIVGLPECSVLSVDDGMWKARPRCPRSLDEEAVGHPEPETVNREWPVGRQTYSEHPHFGDASDVFERIAVKPPPRAFSRGWRVSPTKHYALSVKGGAMTAYQLTTLDFCAPRAAAKMIADKVLPATFGRAQPAGGNEDPGYDLQARFAGFVEKCYVVF